MKLFAKRTKKVAAQGTPSRKKRTVFKSDPVCEELLQKDPSTWNAKERRMIKRYQKRKTEEAPKEDEDKEADEAADVKEDAQEKEGEGDEKPETDDASDSMESDEDDEKQTESKDKDDSEVVGETEDQSEEEMALSADEDSGSDDSDGSGDESEDANGKEANVEVKEKSCEEETAPEKESSAPSDEKQGVEDEPVQSDPTSKPKVSADANATDLTEILERLDSKNRRKLRRKLDRGEASAEDIRKEAMAILEPPKESGNDKGSGKRDADETVPAEDAHKKGQKRRKVDWSTLPPEERMRREEQRRIQQEVAARRAAGEMPSAKHSHPLNSERRRANRRKPKWEKPKNKPVGNDHDTSGFRMRKTQPSGH